MLKDLRTLWAILGFVTMTPVIASLIRNGLHLPTGGIVAVVLDQYGIYRDAIFSLVEMGLKYLSELFKLLPAFVRDLVSFYSIGFTAWMLTSRWTYLDDKRRYEEDRQNFEEAIRGAASDHNKNAEKNWLKVQLGLLNPKFRMLRADPRTC